MIRLDAICSLTDFQRNAKEHIERLKKTGQPEVLTVNGQAEVVVQDAESYQKLLDALEHAETMAGIWRGIEDMRAGRGKPAEQVFAELRRKHQIPRRAAG